MVAFRYVDVLERLLQLVEDGAQFVLGLLDILLGTGDRIGMVSIGWYWY